MTLSLFSYRGMSLNKILATNENDDALGTTIVDNPLESYFTEETKYKLLTTNATMVQQDLKNVIYSVPSLSSLAGQNYSAYYYEYNTSGTYDIDLTNAKACFSRMTIILIGGGGNGSIIDNGNGGGGGVVIYQINLSILNTSTYINDNTIRITVGDNLGTTTGTGDTILYWINRGELAKAGGGKNATGNTNGTAGNTIFTSTYDICNKLILSYTSNGKSGDSETNTGYTVNGYKNLLNTINKDSPTYPILYNNPNFYSGTEGPNTTNKTPYPGYARVYYML
jgi:hypothetical protein